MNLEFGIKSLTVIARSEATKQSYKEY